jgi:hypothetical protein
MLKEHQPTKMPSYRIARCPNCDRHSSFTYLGGQHWSERVAKATAMTPLVHLWRCDHCQTTIATPDVEIARVHTTVH